MKDQEKAAPRRRELVGRNEFPPFKRNQIRWALHCYRWKHGISWEKYPYEIAHALGMKGLGEGLNSRDPRGFVLEDQTPKPEKLRLYERFIETVAPDYAKAFSEDGLVQTCADMLARYLAPLENLPEIKENVIATAETLEGFVYFHPFPGFDTDWQPVLYNDLSILGLRRIGDTPYLQVFSFTIGEREVFSKTDPAFIQWRFDESREVPREEFNRRVFDEILRLAVDDETAIRNCFTGLAVPDQTGIRYIGVLRNIVSEVLLANLQICSFSNVAIVGKNRWTRRQYEFDRDNIYFDASMIINSNREKKMSPQVITILLHGRPHDGIQDFIERMKP